SPRPASITSARSPATCSRICNMAARSPPTARTPPRQRPFSITCNRRKPPRCSRRKASRRAKRLNGFRRAHAAAFGNRARRLVQRLDGEARGGLVAGHELRALLRRDHVVDIVERSAAAFVDEIEQPERPCAAIAQDELRDRSAQFGVVS